MAQRAIPTLAQPAGLGQSTTSNGGLKGRAKTCAFTLARPFGLLWQQRFSLVFLQQYSDAMPPHHHPSKPNRKFGLRFFAILVLIILFIGIFVPFFAHTGPTRKLQGRLAQEAIECLSDQIAKWEKDHPSASPVDLDDIREHDADRAYVKPESQLFMAYLNDHSQATRPDHVWGFSFLGRILSHPEWNLHRQTPSNGQSNEVRVSTLFQYSRGPQDELFEFHSWERKPMEQYMAFAQRKEIMKVISMSAGPFFIWLTLAVIVFFLLRPKTSSPNDPPTSIDRNPQ